MSFNWRLAVTLAVLVFLALFAFRLAFDQRDSTYQLSIFFPERQSFESGRKNYATANKSAPGPAGQSIGDSQKYEKIATLTEVTSDYERDRKGIDGLSRRNRESCSSSSALSV